MIVGIKRPRTESIEIEEDAVLAKNKRLGDLLGALYFLATVEKVSVEAGEPFKPQHDEVLCRIRIKYPKTLPAHYASVAIETLKDIIAEATSDNDTGTPSYIYAGDEVVIEVPYTTQNAALYFHN